MLYRSVAASCVALVSALAASQTDKVTMNAFIQGKPAGEATITRAFTRSGETTRTAMTLTQMGQKLTIDIVSTSNRSGLPLKKITKITAQGNTITISTTFGPKGATVVQTPPGVTKTFPMVTKTTRTDVTDLWFVRVKPHVGQVAKYQSFEPVQRKWMDVTTTYVGRSTVDVNGKKVPAHLLKQKREGLDATIYVDDKGMPIKTEEPALTLIRK
jgi:hypothetical protein